MIIKRLTMNNFGVYAGLNTFEFSHSKPVVLIGGMNGRGKTTFLEAILLALYGNNSPTYKEGKNKTFAQYLRAHVNKSRIDETCFIELSFVLNEKDSDYYLVRREWNALTKKTNEKLTVKKNEVIDDFLTVNWAMFVENLLPSVLSSFYFFNGEKIAELAVDNTDKQMKESIRSMLGINVLDILKSDLQRNLKRYEKKVKGEAKILELQESRDKQEMMTQELDSLSEKILNLNDMLLSEKEKLERLHGRYVIEGGTAIEQRQTLIEQRAKIVAEIDQLANALIGISSGELPLILVKDLIQNIKLDAVDEHNDFILQQAITQIDSLLLDYSKVNNEDININRKFVEYIKAQTQLERNKPIYDLSEQALFQINSLLESTLAQKRKEALEILGKKKELKRELDEVDSYLAMEINENILSKLLTQIKKQEEKVVELQVQLSTLEQKQETLTTKLAATKAEYKRTVDIYLEDMELVDDSKRAIKYSNIALNIIDLYTTELQKRKTDLLGKTVTECYKKLANKKNLIQEITVDSQLLNLSYIDKTGKEVTKESLSAGEKQLMVIAILWALAICSSKKLPVIIDTPLSRLDSMHRKSLVSNYFPYASDQTIILSTDSEIDHFYYNLMKEYVGDEFTLVYNEETQSTKILKGYFKK